MAKANKLIILAIIIFCFLCLVFVQSTGLVAHAYGLVDPSQENSEQNPYLITSAQDLADLSSQVLDGDSKEGLYFRLALDINLDESYTPIGNLNNQFKGIFDGNHLTIYANINNTTAYNGIFGAVGVGGAVVNLRVFGSITGGNNTGSVAGYSLGTIDNCINEASINAHTAQTESVGGIVGLNYGLVTDCINRGTIVGNSKVGGIVGTNATTGNSISTLNGIINLGDINNVAGKTSSVVGGIVGQNDGIVKNGYNYSLISNTGNQIGSLIGYFTAQASLSGSKNCYNNTYKSASPLIGNNAQILPSNYTSYNMHEFLGKKTLVFESGIMSVKQFDIGYGYFPMLNEFIWESTITDWVRHSIFASGAGFLEDPFVIDNKEQWDLFDTNTKIHDYKNTYVKLNVNIEQTTPLASADSHFNGNFDGNNKTITLNMAGVSFLGVFSHIGASGKVHNLNISGWVQASGAYAGSVAGYTSGSIENVTNTATVMASSFAGGIAGQVYNQYNILSFINVKNSGKVQGVSKIGGIAGYGYNPRTNHAIVNSGEVQGSTSAVGDHFGGIFGEIENDSDITYYTWLNQGAIKATQGNFVGGLIGKINLGIIEGSVNIGAVTGKSNVGGIAGLFESGTLYSVAVISNITGASNTAGMVGAISAKTDISESYFSGKFYKLPNSPIGDSFAIIANSNNHELNLTQVYYNIDILDGEGAYGNDMIVPNPQGVGANHVQLTDVNGSAHSIAFDVANAYWNILPKSIDSGYYPIPKNFDQASHNLIRDAVKYSYFNAGDGAGSSPFAINSAQHLYNLSYLHNNYTGYASLEYIQTADIILDTEFTPIGITKAFSGKYNGNYYKIHNLIITGQDSANYGLFGNVLNTNLTKIAIASGSISGSGYLGAIAGQATNATIINSYSLINIVSVDASYAGGIAGYVSGGTIENCFNAGRINALTNAVGGIAGYSRATIAHSFNMGMVTGDNGAVAGGIVGNNASGVEYGVRFCYNSGTVKVTADAFVGGLVGSSDGTITDSYTIAKVLYISHAKAGAISGRVNQGVESFLIRSFYNSNLCSLPPFSGTLDNSLARTTQEMESASIVDEFSIPSNYEFGLQNSQDSHYAPRLATLKTGNDDIEKYTALSVRLRLFGWNDDSNAEWGSEDNPYLLSSRTQFDDLSDLVLTYNYTGYYFALTNDIDMRVDGNYSNFRRIGYYLDPHDSRAFNGVLNGKGYKISYLYIDSSADYVGLFGMLGDSGSIKNLVIDANSVIKSSGSHVGSFVGRNMAENGEIDRCVSYATVQGNTHVGGIVGYTYANTTITNCLFNGTVAGNSYIYGVIGISHDSVSEVDITNSWYVVELASGYITNGYNSTLFVDGNGSVEVLIDTGASDYEFIIFKLVADQYFVGVYMDSSDFVVSTGELYYAIDNTNLKSMYARFTLPVTASITGDHTAISVQGEGRYYCGQQVTIKVSFQEYGYFINIFDFDTGTLKLEYQDYVLENDAELLWIKFVMPHSFDNLSVGKVLNLAVVDANGYVGVTTHGTQYSGDSNDAVAEIMPQGLGYFDNTVLRYYFGVQKNLTEHTANAGQYEVRARLTVHTSFNLAPNLFLGIISKTFTISPKTLHVSWQNVMVKEYDSLDDNNIMISQNPVFDITGTLEKDQSQVMAYGTVHWNSPNVGQGIALTVTNFNLTGDMATNYFIDYSLVVAGGIGQITAKNITVTIDESSLKHTYNNAMPIITQVTVTGSLGEISLEYSFTPMQTINNPWDAGWYEVGVSTTNTNYIVNLTPAELEIVPIAIESINYDGFSNLTYSGVDLASGIKGTYSTLFSGIDTVGLTFYYQGQQVGLSQVINAGSYEAVPTLNKTNYKLSPSVNTLTFIVKKSQRQSQLVISVMENIATIGDGNLPITIDHRQEGKLTLNKIDALPLQRGAVQLLDNDGAFELSLITYGEITFTITEYDCQNYVDSTSNTIVLDIKPRIVYIGFKETSWYYGDEIALEFVYSWDTAQSQVLAKQDIDNITSFTRPLYRMTDNKLKAGQSYEVKIQGASSNNCEFLVSDNNYIEIVKRPIEIVVEAENTLNSKIYGQDDKPISYRVKDGVTNYMINALPNGLALDIQGQLSRNSGENAGLYSIASGTITNELNANFDISFDIRGEYEVVRKGIRLVMPNLAKNYGVQDPELTPLLAEGFAFVDGDSISDIAITVSRMTGEDIGEYNYILDYSENSGNYSILSVEVEQSKFEIKKGTATLVISSITPITYGEILGTGTIYGNASYLGKAVSGTFSWINSTSTVDSMQYQAQVRFTPDNDNISTTEVNTLVPVAKRQLLVRFSGVFEYNYTGSAIKTNYKLELNNAVDGKVPQVKGEIQGVAKNVGEYIIEAKLTDDGGGVYELDHDSKHATLRIYPAKIVVSVERADIVFGDEFVPKITYSGFVGLDDQSVLLRHATIGELPKAIGYHLLTPSGAQATNYTFDYQNSTLAIKKAEIVTSNVKLTGVLAPETSVATAQLSTDTKEYGDIAKGIDSLSGSSLLKPSRSQMVEYLKFDIDGELAADTQYQVKLATQLDDDTVIYVVSGDGKIKMLTDYTVDDQGNVVFNAGNIRGVGVYQPKDYLDIAKSYLPIAGVALGVILIITLAIFISKFSRKLERARRENRLR